VSERDRLHSEHVETFGIRGFTFFEAEQKTKIVGSFIMGVQRIEKHGLLWERGLVFKSIEFFWVAQEKEKKKNGDRDRESRDLSTRMKKSWKFLLFVLAT
jgi:hypothetical protein